MNAHKHFSINPGDRMERNERVALAWSGLWNTVGTLLFLWGGSQHPKAGPNLGVLGSDEYWSAFAAIVHAHQAWGPVHARILLGPLCWAIGAYGFVAALRARGVRLAADVAAGAYTLGATAWAAAFTFDGWIAPAYAQAVASASEASVRAAALLGFRTTQDYVVRLGLVSWTTLAVGALALTAGVLEARLWGPIARRAIVAVGAGLAVWSIFAWITGEFLPGPFTSRYWTITAIATSLWYLALGLRSTASR